MIWRIWFLGWGVIAGFVALTLAIHWVAMGSGQELDTAIFLRDMGLFLLGWTAFCGLLHFLIKGD